MNEQPQVSYWADVAVLATRKIFGGIYRVSCGECTGHGSMGVVILEDVATAKLLVHAVQQEQSV